MRHSALSVFLTTVAFALPAISSAAAPVRVIPDLPDPDAPTYEVIDGPGYDCQPETFDPGVTKYHTEGSHHVINGTEDGIFFINGLGGDNNRIQNLATPFSMTYYSFECDAVPTYVLEIRNNGKRHALYTHVWGWSVTPDGRTLYLSNRVQKNGQWQEMRRIIDIASKSSVSLPMMQCTSNPASGYWSGTRLLTRGYGSDVFGSDRICVWDTKGKFISQLETSEEQSYGMLIDGILRSDPKTYYAYPIFSKDKGMCSLLLQRLDSPALSKTIHLFPFTNSDPDIGARCPFTSLELNLRSLRWSGGTVKYRITTNKGPGTWKTVR